MEYFLDLYYLSVVPIAINYFQEDIVMNNMHKVAFFKKGNKYTAKVPTRNNEGDVLLGVGKCNIPGATIKADVSGGVLELDGHFHTSLVIADVKLHYC